MKIISALDFQRCCNLPLIIKKIFSVVLTNVFVMALSFNHLKAQENSLSQFLTSQNYHEVRLRKLPTGQMGLAIFLNNMPGLFILDTGASITVVDEKQKDLFKLQLTLPEEGFNSGAGAGGSGLAVYSADNNKLQIGDLFFEPFKISAMDFGHVNTGLQQLGIQEVIHGVIGADILEPRQAVIDYASKCLYLKVDPV